VALRANATEALLREMQAIVRLAAEPRVAADSTKAAIGRAATVLQLNYRRAYSLWYRSDKLRVSPEEAARLRAERDRLQVLRLERLEREIAETKRLLQEARRHDAAAQAAAGGRSHLASGVAASGGEAPPVMLRGACVA
jgi:hypothetical protein